MELQHDPVCDDGDRESRLRRMYNELERLIKEVPPADDEGKENLQEFIDEKSNSESDDGESV